MAEPRIDVLIFSKDRPAQLDLLLRSIQRHARGLYQHIHIIYDYSDDVSFGKGYGICALDHNSGQVRIRNPFITWGFSSHTMPHADDFENLVRGWLCRPNQTISFLCDDDVFYRDAQEPEELPWSYRGGDYDYPFSVDGNVYAKDDVVKLIDGLHFRNPTELEAFAHECRRRLPFAEVSHGEPCLVGIPANRVSVSSGMPHMGQDERDLNERYLAGERLALFGQQVVGEPAAHANLELVFA